MRPTLRAWKLGLGAAQVAERRSQPPVERRGAQRPVEHVEAQAGQVEDPRLVAVGGAGEGLEAIQRAEGTKPLCAWVSETLLCTSELTACE
jgi:hypothetical protein